MEPIVGATIPAFFIGERFPKLRIGVTGTIQTRQAIFELPAVEFHILPRLMAGQSIGALLPYQLMIPQSIVIFFDFVANVFELVPDDLGVTILSLAPFR